MANEKFPGPSINRLLDSSPKIVRVDQSNAEWGSRKSAMPKNVRNDMTIEHTGKKGG
jgi:hypothetical protein